MIPSACPKCGANKVLPLLYGMPGMEVLELAEKNLLALGGCTIFEGDQPCWACGRCHHQWGEMSHPEGEACRALLKRIYQEHVPVRERVRVRRNYPDELQPWLDYLLTLASLRGSEFLVIEYVPDSRRVVDCPTAYLVQGGQRERIEDGGVARDLVNQGIPREAHGPGQAVRVFVQDREVLLGLEQGTMDGRTQLTLRLEALADLSLPPVKAPAHPPACPYCGKILRPAHILVCFRCGLDWHDPDHVLEIRSRR